MKIVDGFVILFYKKAINSKEVNMKKFVAFILACILGFITFFIVVGSLNFFFYRKIDREHTEEEQK